jgi:hypothetical protein
MTKSTHNPNEWTITVEYDAGFDASDLAGPSFRDGFRVMERTGDINQILTGTLSLSVFNPSTSSVRRRMSARVDIDTLDVEPGAEEFLVEVRLRRLDETNRLVTQNSSLLRLDAVAV